ncbi:hypothetical protein NV226_00380 [Mycoplasma iguanae]|uniref:DUF3196 domain-containing protein n=1 Tax=Mycoplasma iguanae TaxID=292461 RepID=A0ABY5RAX8_9MOLU|nr:DUF3196 family protein [Mycoplasma iguanae]UVD81765.1 hypothetical protein NV226_00380 [Mycoplasma iguanae]
MEKNYYDEILEKINLYINKEEYKAAYDLLKQELTLPYVPAEYETKFQNILEELNMILNHKIKENNGLKLSNDQLFDVIENNEVMFLQYALETLENVALINYVLRVQKIFSNSKIHHEIKALFYEMLVKQKIDYDFEINHKKFNPLKLGSIASQSNYKDFFSKLEKAFEKEINALNVAFYIGNKYLLSIFDQYILNNEILDQETSFAIEQLTQLFLQQKQENELSSKAKKIMLLINEQRAK